MIFWRILDNKLYSVNEVEKLGFEESEGIRIPDEYLERQIFTIMRTTFGIGDWGIISAMPRLLKQKYPNCKVYVPSIKLIERLFANYKSYWETWNSPFNNMHYIFDNNPYVDAYKDYIIGDIFHDHYRIYNKNKPNIQLIKQMLKFWQFTEDEMKDCKPEIYWTEKEKKLGDKIISEYIDNKEFGCLLVSDRFGTQNGKYDKGAYNRDTEIITKVLKDNQLPYFYWTSKPIRETPFNFIDKTLDMRNINLRIQLYIKSRAKINISNQCGTNQIVARYSKCYESQRQFPIKHNFVEGEIYL